MDQSQEVAALKTAVLVMAHAIRLGITLPGDAEEEWPDCPWERMALVHSMLEPLALTSTTMAAVVTILDERTEEDALVDQDALLTRLEKLAPSTSRPRPQ